MSRRLRALSFTPNRRDFMMAAASLTIAGTSALASKKMVAAKESNGSVDSGPCLIEQGQTILFQGDSITDCGRSRELESTANSKPALGSGYAWLAASKLLVDRPDHGLKIFNRGNGGNKLRHLIDRWQADCLDLKPSIVSILIGVNDFWPKAKDVHGTLRQYETDYRTLINQTRRELPDVRLIICEPFALDVGFVDAEWFPDFDGYRAAAKRVAEEAQAVFVPFQTMFDLAVQVAPPEQWAADGVHPSADGAALMAHWWLKAVGA